MSNLLQNSAFKKTLMNYTVGLWADKKSKIADFIAPTVQVPAVAGYFNRYDNSDAFRLQDTAKQPGQAARVLSFAGSPTLYDCKPQALDSVVPEQLLSMTDPESAMIHYQAIANYIVSEAAINHEYQVFSKVTANVSATAGYGTNWSTATGSAALTNPMSEIETAYYTITTAIGTPPNRMLVGTNAWRYIKYAFTSKGYFPAYATNDNSVKEFFSGLGQGLEVKVATLGYAQAAGVTTRSMTNIVSANDVYIFYAENTPSINDRSAFKTFTFGPGFDNMRTYISPDQRDTYLATDWNVDCQLTNQYGIIRITAT